jgi:hypothetical protein
LKPFYLNLGVKKAGQEYDGYIRLAFLQQNQRLKPVHFRHLYIQQYQVRRQFLHHSKHLCSRWKGHHPIKAF